MKSVLFILIAIVFIGNTDIKARNQIHTKAPRNNLAEIDDVKSVLEIKNNDSLSTKQNTLKRDSVNITQTKKTENNGSILKNNKFIDRYWENGNSQDQKFKGHLSLFEMGVNSFAKVNYAGYSVPDFMDLDQNKSYEVNINILSYSLGIQKIKNSIGFVTGLGFNFNDYRFSNPYTIVNEGGHVQPSLLDNSILKKTKLSTTYITVPLMIEFQIPVKGNNKRVYISGGVVGGMKIGSHTKVKNLSQKEKEHEDFNISAFRYGATARLGYKGINLFGTYYHTTFFKEGRGPIMYPFSIGIGIITR